jgi:4-amino-4-deoxy-L-arabinose transferase-like glycosyltransferase
MTAGSPNLFSKKIFYLLIGIGIVLNATGLFNQILEPDSALYAAIAKQIALSNDWVNLYGDGSDWLDKPHFPFWMAAISFKIFGINAFAYKLPAFLFWLAGARFTFLLARLLFNQTIAAITVIIYISSLHTAIANFDVRAEAYLTCCIVAAIYYICRSEQSNNIGYIILAALFTACAVMTKGIFILCTVAGGHVLYWIIKKEWQQFINYKWWLLLLLTFVFILPELYCLYVQFDMHPEKIVFGKTNVSGIRFFFWDSQFGRFFNTGPIKGKGDKIFFLHTTLWAFLPWAVLFYIAVVQLIRRKISMPKTHWIISGGAAITFLLFSLSSFQLPHYIIIIFPHFSMLTAVFLSHYIDNKKVVGRIIILQSALVLILALGLTALAITCKFPYYGLWIAFVWISTHLFMLYRNQVLENVLIKGVAFAFILCFFLNLYFYPNILQYQSGMLAGTWLKNNKPAEPVMMYKTFSYSLDFYAPGKVQRVNDEKGLQQYLSANPTLIYAPEENISELKDRHYKVEKIKSFDFFRVSRLDLKFLNHKTRQTRLQKMVLAKISKE